MSAVAAKTSGPALAPGTVVGGRFAVEAQEYADHLGIVLRSKDEKTGKPIALRLLPPGLVDGAGMKILRAECRTAASLSHKNIVTTYGVGTAGGRAFVATEWVQGRPLTDVIAARRKSGGHMSLGNIYAVLEQVCNALTAAQPKTSHGTLRPSAVWIADDGQVHVTDFGLGRALVAARGASAFSKDDQSCFAPEVKAGSAATAAADIFGLGAILYLLLTGNSPADGFVPPSQAHPDASAAVDQVLLTCLSADPAARFASPDEVRAAMQPLVAGGITASLAEDLGTGERVPSIPAPPISDELDVDIDLGSIAPPAGPPASQPASQSSQPASRSQGSASLDPFAPPKVGGRVSIHEEFRTSIPDARPSTTDLGHLLKQITENDSHRWMADKDGLSHGPFDGRELIELIVKGEILEEHLLSNMDTGEKKPVSQWAEFREFVEQQKLRKRELARKSALDDAEKSQKRSGTTKLLVGGLLLVGVIAGVVLFFMSRKGGADQEVADAELGELFAHGEIEIEGTAGILPDPPRGTGRGMRASMGGGGGGGFAGSYEDAMNRAVELGDVNSGGGQGRLSPAQVSGVLNQHVNRIYQSCVVPEASRGGRLGNVTIDVAIAGNGGVMGVSARQGSGAFKSCVQGVVRRVRFPSFGAPRMGARYSFDASP